MLPSNYHAIHVYLELIEYKPLIWTLKNEIFNYRIGQISSKAPRLLFSGFPCQCVVQYSVLFFHTLQTTALSNNKDNDINSLGPRDAYMRQ